ncbi:phosphotransferase enzyme family protein [Aaosphaeria arxii CBS 175.79]|uniref:Altered inheritance of mitochondria protein 9, mitochondrial n=1 Tax=Aaosphaeria arxii CBS 175.79 TaxID=1450172 RepID=A0A6A5XB58_9PLEO|nr:phosphotransferase enzyme family protein [Aaosphaeria arxii CBS 175.79]KAF2010202.1 phosphotransferase enzyme family protein [Aaosphaeria arxii CBS 175.79]
MAPECPKQADPLFFYTSGRWLWNEDKQLQERFRYFLVPELQEAGRHAVGASRCLAITKIGEGNLNKAYRLEMDDGQIVVGKIPHPNAGPSFFTTASEVATMEYARSVLGLPVPKVLAWSASDNNPVGAEYIIMEEAKGTQLNRVWDDLPLKFRCDILRQVVDIESRLLSVSFQQIGSLYFKDSNVPGCMPAAPTAGSQKIVDQISSRFCLGPIARREFWENERAHMSQHQGPWTSASEYMVSVAQREMEWINLYGSSQLDSSLDVSKQFQFISSNQNSPDVHISALERYISAVPHLIPRDPTMTCPRFWHPDFHAGNIFIDEQNRISSIIDWPPLMLDYSVERRLFFPDNFKTLNEDEKNEIRYQVSQSILINSYETATAKINPVIHQKLHHPAGKTLKQLETFAGGSWDNCIFPLIECLLHVKR